MTGDVDALSWILAVLLGSNSPFKPSARLVTVPLACREVVLSLARDRLEPFETRREREEAEVCKPGRPAASRLTEAEEALLDMPGIDESPDALLVGKQPLSMPVPSASAAFG